MLVTCWSVKGGVGVTVVAATLAVLLGRRTPGGSLLADLGGDAPAALGLPEPGSPGLADWLAGGTVVPVDALGRLEIEVTPGVGLLPRGPGNLAADRADVLAAQLAGCPRPVVVDCGTGGASGAVTTSLIRCAQRSVLVTRPCYLALRRAMSLAERPTEVVLVREPGRALSRDDVERVVRAPVTAEVELDPAVARAVDSSGLAGRLPRSLERGLRGAA
jgi:MinD-like ATPase involved in chromosome partitioning or flagellar assembly